MPLVLLLRLMNKRFPVMLTADADIRHASVLVATGLIEAEFHVDNFGYQRVPKRPGLRHHGGRARGDRHALRQRRLGA
ncbi:hypothetical protein ACFJIS_31890 [Variovorax boronicumulans]|uniref:hypothetical protein n=1 Tax=Variovorax boronicumulans TaxID=436515 RepID=UPI0036F1AD0F